MDGTPDEGLEFLQILAEDRVIMLSHYASDEAGRVPDLGSALQGWWGSRGQSPAATGISSLASKDPRPPIFIYKHYLRQRTDWCLMISKPHRTLCQRRDNM